MELINEGTLVKLIQDTVKEMKPWLEEDLTGRTIGIDEFRKKYCGGKSTAWVRLFIFDEFSETDYSNGGFVINPHKQGSKTIIFEKTAAEWMEENRRRIDWDAQLPA